MAGLETDLSLTGNACVVAIDEVVDAVLAAVVVVPFQLLSTAVLRFAEWKALLLEPHWGRD